jgi:hypothetical protein
MAKQRRTPGEVAFLASVCPASQPNRYYATFNQFTKAIFDFFRTTLPEKWPEFRDTVTDNFRIVSFKEYRTI